MSNTVRIKGYLNVNNEAKAAEIITPGMLIELTSAALVQPHSTVEGNVAACFAMEDALQGKGIDDNYAVGDIVQCWTPVRGEEVNAILADGYDIDVGDFLASNGDGMLREYAGESGGGVQPLVAVAREAVDTSGSSGEESSGPLGYAKRIRVVVM